jgi:putative oxidoreductase
MSACVPRSPAFARGGVTPPNGRVGASSAHPDDRYMNPAQSAPAPAPARMAVDLGLLFLRVSASLLLLVVHGLPKLVHYTAEAAAIEDPFHLGRTLSILFAIFAEVVCPIFMIVGLWPRLAALPVMIITVVALVFVHPDWCCATGSSRGCC